MPRTRVRAPPSLPILGNITATLKRWGAELRNQDRLDVTAFLDWDPLDIKSYTASLTPGALTITNISVQGARYWIPSGGDVCDFSAEIKFDITGGTADYVGVPLPVPDTVETVGQYIFVSTLFGTTSAERRVVPGIVSNGLLYVPRQVDFAVNQWATQANNYIILSGRYRVSEI